MPKVYTVLVDTFIDGAYRAGGEELTLSERAAKYLLMNGQLAEKAYTVAEAKPTAQKAKGDT